MTQTPGVKQNRPVTLSPLITVAPTDGAPSLSSHPSQFILQRTLSSLSVPPISSHPFSFKLPPAIHPISYPSASALPILPSKTGHMASSSTLDAQQPPPTEPDGFYLEVRPISIPADNPSLNIRRQSILDTARPQLANENSEVSCHYKPHSYFISL